MLFPKPLTRIRFWIGIVALLCLVLYFLMQYNEVRHNSFIVLCLFRYFLYISQYLEEEELPKALPVFKWLPIHNITFLDHCRNSQQGNSLIVDELGTWHIHTGRGGVVSRGQTL